MHRWLIKGGVGIFFALMLGLYGMIPLVQAEGTAAFQLSPLSRDIQTESSFDLQILVNPNAESLDTVRANISFPPDLLEVEHVELGTLFPHTSPGNGVDEAKGIISEGGFTLDSPVTIPGTFATITFKTKKEGTATISILNTSRLIAGGEEKMNNSSLATATVTIRLASPPEADTGVRLFVTSETHPDQNLWYAARSATVSWQVQGGTISRYYSAFDKNPETNPTASITSSTGKSTMNEVTDGVWYFHLKGQQSNGVMTAIQHYRFQIDGTVPNPIAPITDDTQLSQGSETYLRFGTTDEISGIRRYELSINDGPFVPQVSPVLLSDLSPGDYYLRVKALDQAGNATYGLTTARVYPKGMYLEGEKDQNNKQISSSVLEKQKMLRLLIIPALVLISMFGIMFFVTKNRRKK